MGLSVFTVAPAGPPLASEADARDLIGQAIGAGAGVIAIPVGRLAPSFFDLKTREAGLFIQKIVNYRMRVAFIGDLSAEIARSAALGDFVRESNRGEAVWFVADQAALAARLSRA